MSNPYRYREFIVFKQKGAEYVVINMLKPFKEGHAHLRSFKSCKDAIYFVTTSKIPENTGFYFLTSLQRLSKDKEYIARIEKIKQKRWRKDYVRKS